VANCAVVTRVLDTTARDRAAQSLRRAGARLPSFAELADPSNMPRSRVAALHSVDPDRPNPANLFRVHWYNDRSRTGFAALPPHLCCHPN
jgi:cysteine synthase A